MDGFQLHNAIDLFNRQAFFECHEVLEALWKPLPPGPEKTFLQGWIQIAVGFHHLQHQNFVGARNKLQSGLQKLEQVASEMATDAAFEAPFLLPPFSHAVRHALETVLTLGPERLAEFPEHLMPRFASE